MKTGTSDLLLRLQTLLSSARSVDKALRTGLRLTREFYGGCDLWLAVRVPGAPPRIRVAFAQGEGPDADLVERFLEGRRPRVPHDHLLGRVKRRGRNWAVVVLRRAGGVFDRDELATGRKIAETLSTLIQRLDRARAREIHDRVQRRIMEQLRPEDLFYQVLHGLRELTHYDHSGSLWIYDERRREIELAAEQIAWRKGPSGRIGARLPVNDRLRGVLRHEEVYGFDHGEAGWVEWRGRDAHALVARLVEDPVADGVPVGSAICAPLSARGHVLGALCLAARTPGTIGVHEAELVRRFLPATSVAIQNRRHAQALEQDVLDARTQVVMAELARRASHDIKNGVGAVLLQVQELIHRTEKGTVDPATQHKMLKRVEQGMRYVAHMGENMLRVHQPDPGPGADVQRMVSNLAAVLDGELRLRQVELQVALDERLPRVKATQQDLLRLVLNLAHNAVQAMGREPRPRAPGEPGRRLRIAAARTGDNVQITVLDNGPGIEPEVLQALDLSRLYGGDRPVEVVPGAAGAGMGLAACVRLCRELGGSLELRTEADPEKEHGTLVVLLLPVAREDQP